MGRPMGRVVAVAGARVTLRLDRSGDDTAGSAEIHALVHIAASRSAVYGTIRELHVVADATAPGGEVPVAELELLGERLPGGDEGALGAFERGVVHFPSLGDFVYAATTEDLAAVYTPRVAGRVPIGTLDRDGTLPAAILGDDLLSKHFAILGTTGSGKSCTVAVLLRALLAGHPNAHVILLDPHDEYRSAFGKRAVYVSPETISLPYWMLNFEEMVGLLCSPDAARRETEADILKSAILTAKEAYQGEQPARYAITVDTPVPYHLNTAVKYIDRAMGQLSKPGDTLPYLRLKARIDTLRSDRRFAFMFGGLAVQDTMTDILAKVLRVPVDGKPITIVDLSAVPVEIVDTVVSVLTRTIFDFAVWSADGEQVPVLLVCEEAHRYIPADDTEVFAPTRKALSRIAKEGRKYGISLGLVTQRPSDMSEAVLSQCSTLFALRMSNDRDQEFVRRALPEGAGALFNALPALGTGEAVVVGEAAAVPMRLRLHALAYEDQPHKGELTFSEAWRYDKPDRARIEAVVDRWRRQAREDRHIPAKPRAPAARAG